MHRSGVDPVFKKLMDDPIHLEGGRSEYQNLLQITMLDQVAQQGALLLLGNQIGQLMDQIDPARFIGDSDHLRIAQDQLLDL